MIVREMIFRCSYFMLYKKRSVRVLIYQNLVIVRSRHSEPASFLKLDRAKNERRARLFNAL